MATYPIIKVQEGLIAVDREADTPKGAWCYSNQTGMMMQASDDHDPAFYPSIIAASPSLNLGVMELPEDPTDEELNDKYDKIFGSTMWINMEIKNVDCIDHKFYDHIGATSFRAGYRSHPKAVPLSCEIDNGKFIKYNF